jgi:cell division protease FtsH
MTRKSLAKAPRRRPKPAIKKVAGRRPKTRTRGKPAQNEAPATWKEVSNELPIDVGAGLVLPVAALPAKPAQKKSKVTARCAIVASAFHRATDAPVRALLKSRRPLALIILVPAPDWIEPVLTLFVSRYGAAWQPVQNKVGAVADLLKAERNAQVAIDISRGLPVIGVATHGDDLPSALAHAADLTIRIDAPDGACIGRAIRIFTGAKALSGVDDAIPRGLDFHDLVAAFRKRSSPADIVERLRKAGVARPGIGTTDRLPSLHSAVEYGLAREFGLLVAKDVAEWKAGRLKNWKTDVDRAAVLVGEPGLGKTYYCKLLAEACNAHFLSFSVAELFQNSAGYLDSVIKASRVFFDKAAVLAASRSAGSGPSCCVLLLDEIDAVGNRANFSDSRGREWFTIFLTSFMLAIENAADGVIIIGATNNVSAVDAALLRPGRLERTIEFKRPGHAGIVNILKHHLDGSLADADLTDIGHLMAGSTPADIMMAARGARRIARNAGRELRLDDLLQAVAPVEEIEPAALMRICIHEAAHAVASLAVPAGVLHRCIIGGQTDSAGRTIIKHETADLATRDSVERRAVAMLAGRAAEKLCLGGSISLGSGGDDFSDLAVVTQYISSLHAATGLGGSLVYLVSHEDALQAVRNDLKMRARVERHIRRLHRRADDLVREHRNAIVAVAEQLRIRRHLSGDEIRRIFEAAPPSKLPAPTTRH